MPRVVKSKKVKATKSKKKSRATKKKVEPKAKKPKSVTKPEPVVETPEPVVEPPKVAVETPEVAVETPKVAVETPEVTKVKRVKRKRSFRLHEFNPDHGKKPKNGGYYIGSSPQACALKASNRWVCPKGEYEVVYSFCMREITKTSPNKKIYEFHAKRTKLEPPRMYKRGGKTITVDSKIQIVPPPSTTD